MDKNSIHNSSSYRALVLFDFQPRLYGIDNVKLQVKKNSGDDDGTISEQLPFIAAAENDIVEVLNHTIIANTIHQHHEWSVIRKVSNDTNESVCGLVPNSLLMRIDSDDFLSRASSSIYSTINTDQQHQQQHTAVDCTTADDVVEEKPATCGPLPLPKQNSTHTVSRQIGINAVLLIFTELVEQEHNFSQNLVRYVVGPAFEQKVEFSARDVELYLTTFTHTGNQRLVLVQQHVQELLKTNQMAVLKKLRKWSLSTPTTSSQPNHHDDEPLALLDFYCVAMRHLFDALSSIPHCKPALINLALNAHRQVHDIRRKCIKEIINFNAASPALKPKSIVASKSESSFLRHRSTTKVTLLNAGRNNRSSFYDIHEEGEQDRCDEQPRRNGGGGGFSHLLRKNSTVSSSVENSNKKKKLFGRKPRPHSVMSMPPPDLKRHWRNFAAVFVCSPTPQYFAFRK